VVGAALTLLLMPASAGATFPGENGNIVFQNDSLGGIYSIHADGSGRDKLAGGFEPSWAANGKRIIYTNHPDPAGLDDTEIFTMKANGGDKHRVTHDGVNEWEPVLSPDSKQIAYRTGKFRSTTGKLYAADANGGDRTKIGTGEHLDWSVPLDGAKDGLIAYSGESTAPCFSEPELFTVKPNGHGRTLLPFGCKTSLFPSWSPDGENLAFTNYYEPVGNSDIVFAEPDDLSAVKLTNLPNEDYGAAWSPEGDQVAFESSGQGLYRVARSAPLAETAIPNTDEVNAAQPAWQPK
jgi:Tol biopolymer transport system component